MTGSGNNTYLLAGPARIGRRSSTPASASRAHLADLAAALGARRGSTPCSSRTATAITRRARRRSRPRIPAASFSKLPWPDEDAQYAVRVATARRRRRRRGRRRAAARRCTRRGTRRITWRSGTSRARTIFTGDLVVQGSSVMIHWSRGGDLGQYLASLERLLALEPRRLLPAHGPRDRRSAAAAHRLPRAPAAARAAGARRAARRPRQRAGHRRIHL